MAAARDDTGAPGQSGDRFTDPKLGENLLVPVYTREVTSSALWCSQWWRHPEAVAQLHGLMMAWQEITGPGSNETGPAMWHRDFLGPLLQNLRDPSGPFSGCKPGSHRHKKPPPVQPLI